MRVRVVFLIALSLSLLAVACGGGEGELGVFRVEVDSSGPYPVIRSFGSASEWTAELVATIGSIDTGPTKLAAVRSVLLDRTGSVYVVDSKNVVLAVFDSAGRFLRSLGRNGAGPGEYQNPYSLAWLGDTLALLDPANARIGLFGRDGQWVGSQLLGRAVTGAPVRLYRTLPDGFWAFTVTAGDGGTAPILVHYGSGGPDDTLRFLRAEPALTATAVTCHLPGGGVYRHPAPFAPKLLQVPTPARERAVAITSRYRIAFLSPAGDTLRAIERPHTPVHISDREWDEAATDSTESWEKPPEARCDSADFPRPETRPPIEFLFFDAQGRLWVEVTTEEGTVYDVYSPGTGQLLLTVTGLPPTAGLDPSVLETRAAFVLKDSLGLPQVRVYRLHPRPR